MPPAAGTARRRRPPPPRRRAARAVLWLPWLALATFVLLLAAAHPSAAAPTPPAPTPAASSPAPTGPIDPASPYCQTPAGHADTRCGAPPASAAPATTGGGGNDPAAQEGDGRGVGAQLMGPDGIDLSHYDLGWDDGAWNNVYRHFWGNLTQLVWTLHRWIVQVGIWFLTWTFKFGFAKLLLAPATAVFNAWQHHVIEPLGLPAFFFFITTVWFGWLLIRGRAAAAVAELATALVVSALSGLILANPGQILLGDDGLLGKTRDLSFGVSAMAFGHPEVANQTHPDPASVITPMRNSYTQAFVVQPHMILDWGSSLDAPGANPACLAVYQRNIADGPHGDQDTPRDRMNDAGCTDQYKFNHDPSSERFAGTGMVLIAGLIMTVLMVVICGVVCIAQAIFAAAVIRSCWALLAGLLPSGGRGPLWSTLESLLKAIASIVGSILFLTVFLVTIKALLQANDESLMARLVGMDALVVFGFVFRARLTRVGHRAASKLTHALAKSRHTGVSHGGSWLKPAAAGAGAGFAAAELWHENREEIRRALGPARAVGGKVASTGRAVGRVAGPSAAPAGGGAASDAGGGGAAAATFGQRLKTELSRTRTGKAALGAGQAAKLGGKLAFATTLGAPVTASRAATRARQATGTTTAAMRARLAAAGDATRGYASEWGSSVATVTGARAAGRHLSRTAGRVVDLDEHTRAYPERLRAQMAAAAAAQRAAAQAAARPGAAAKSRQPG